MFSLLFLASIVLPSVIGQCCLPKRMSVTIMEPGNQNPKYFLIDFKKNKSMYKPLDHSHVDFALYDMNLHKSFIMKHDGDCHISEMDEASRVYSQCLPKEAKLTSGFLGPINGMAVDLYGFKQGHVKSAIAVTDGCVPVVSFTVGQQAPTTVHFWVNVTTDVTDSTALDVDVSNCIAEPEIAG